MDPVKQLSLFSENELEARAPHGFPVGCPTLDVTTNWDGDSRNLLIYRPPGQIVSKIHQISAPGDAAPEVVAVTWKPDGQFLAVGWSDGVVRLMGLENNKAAHHIPVCEKSKTSITHIGWASSTILTKSASGHLADCIPGDWASQADQEDQLPANLPLQLTFLELETALPKISPLPAASAGADEDGIVFTLRTGIDFLFQPPKPEEYDKVNVMVVGTSDGKLQLSIYDSFIVGSFQCPAVSPPTAFQMIHHASHPEVSTHALVLADKGAEPGELHLLPMDLPFISSSPINLSLLASKLTTLQKLLRYLKQTQLHILVEWKNARELPGRFLQSVEGDLKQMQSGPRDIVAALYHTVVTGHAYGPVREWLVDSLAERGHKRWDKAVVTGLENIRSLVHENFLPALERCAVILSRLRGLAQFHDYRDDIGFTVAQTSRVLDVIGCLTLVGHRMLTHVMDELDHFAAFSVWLRFQIDRLATSNDGEELGDKEATLNNSKVLAYIERYLTSSPLGVFLDDISHEDCSADWDHCEDGPSLLQMLDRQLQRREEGQPSMKALPQVDFLVNYMTSWCSRIFKGIANSYKRSVRFGKPVPLSLGRPISHMDVKVCDAEKGGVIYTALARKGDVSKVYICRAAIDIVNGISASRPATSYIVDLVDGQLIDFKFLSAKKLLILCSRSDGAPAVFSIPVQSERLPYTVFSVDRPDDVGSVSVLDFAQYRLPVQQTVRPVRMEVHDKSDVRGEIPQRICLLSSKRTTWQTFSLPRHDDCID